MTPVTFSTARCPDGSARGRVRQGLQVANPTSRFIGHAVCDDVEWINGLSDPISESYHPNRLGQSSGYTPLVSPLLGGGRTAGW